MLNLHRIFENVSTEPLIKDIASLLDKRYVRSTGTIDHGLDVTQEKAFESQKDGTIETMGDVVEKLKIKYPKITKEYLAQVAKDWYDNVFSKGFYILTKGINPYE